jgi:MFS family permease
MRLRIDVTGKGMTPGLGADFGRLWTANAISNLGDGVTGVAAPLLVASLTDSPTLVAGAVFAQQLPWLLLSLPSGAYVDRLDRRRLLVGVNLARGALLAGLAAAVWGGVATIPVLYVAFFLVGVGETVADSTSVALLPGIVPADRLADANARLVGTYLVGGQLAAPPFGAWLFVAAAALPFAFDAASFLTAALLVAPLLRRHGPAPRTPDRPARTLRGEIAEGLRWLWRHRTLRLLAVCVAVMNLAGAGTFAIWVLWARQRLGLQGVGFGALVTAYAVGGLLGTLLASRLETALGPATLLRAGLLIEAGSQLSLALTRSPWIAGATLVLFGTHATVWGVVTVSLRQRLVPDRLRGRVGSVYFLFDLGGASLGTLLGGGLASVLGITAPFWLGSGAVALLAVGAWRRLAPTALASSPPVGLDGAA